MLTNSSPVIVKDGVCACCSVHTKQIHHRSFPEIWTESGSVVEGLAHLTNQLSRARDGAGSTWHRDTIEQAIVDVAEYLDSLAEAQSGGETSCRCNAQGPEPSALVRPVPSLS